ncbi:MAG TPA: tRNA adenosine(34) deaminase TadA [Coxiellaceae bacterium]|nr:tRNA adenosine(34) deaminase TadA [Coxiellaceae bacterium]
MDSTEDEVHMRHAMALAAKAQEYGEVPVGAVVVRDGVVIGEGFNQPISQSDPTAHAEVVALRAAANTINNYRLLETTLYVTLEPCLMCLGAMIHGRVSRVVFGAYDTRSGMTKRLLSDQNHRWFDREIVYEGGVLAQECSAQLRGFFQAKR